MLGALITGSGSTLMHLAGSAPATAGFFRSVLALPALAVLALVESRRGDRSRGRPVLGAALLAGAFLAGDLLLWQKSVLSLGAGLSTVVQNTQVLYVAGAGWLLFGERVRARLIAVLPVLLAGVAIIAFGGRAGPAGGPDPIGGTAMALLSALAYAGFIVVLRGRLSDRTTRARALLVVTVSSAAVSAGAGMLAGGLTLDPGWAAIGWLGLLALTSQVLGWTVLMSAIARIGSLRASIVLLVQPASALAWGAAILGERPTGWQVGGIVLVLASVAAMAGGADEAGGATQTGRPPMMLARSMTRTEGQ